MDDLNRGGQPAVGSGTAPAPLADRATATAATVAGQVKDKAAEALGGQKDALADRIDEVAHAVQRSGTQFEGQQDWIAGAIGRGAAELGSLAEALRTRDVGDLLREVRSFAGRQPALFIGASLAAGFALARFGKVVAADLSAHDLPALPEIRDERR